MSNIVHFTFGKHYKRVTDSDFFSEEKKPGRKFNLLVYYEQVNEGIRKNSLCDYQLGHILNTALEFRRKYKIYHGVPNLDLNNSHNNAFKRFICYLCIQ